jgi:RNA polymerase sigma-54 factor
MMRMEHRQAQTQSQQLVLTQKMQQALHVLQLSSMELEHYVQQELETNPFLEQIQQKDEPASENTVEKAEDKGADAFDEPFDLDAHMDRWDMRRKEGQDLSFNADLESRRRFYEDSITQDASLRAHLTTQLHLADVDEASFAIGERIIIGDIDDRGFFTGNEEEIATELTVPVEKVSAMLRKIQRFEPTGVGAHDLTECLLLQIQAEYPDEKELIILVENHMDALLHRQIPQVAKAMKVTPARVEELKTLLATLNPWPGRDFNPPTPHYINADVMVERVDDDLVVSLVGDRIPDMHLNKIYQKEVLKQAQSQAEKEYVRGKVESANWLRRNIEQRQNTILRVSNAIVDVQRDFMFKGVEHIKPLTLQNIADVVGMHESTIARTTRGKYMQTPQGFFELKYFFSPGLSKEGGDDQSSTSIQALVRKIIDKEDKRKPLSDQKIADLIKNEHGISIARRTVTKYREGMNILKTSLRRAY